MAFARWWYAMVNRGAAAVGPGPGVRPGRAGRPGGGRGAAGSGGLRGRGGPQAPSPLRGQGLRRDKEKDFVVTGGKSALFLNARAVEFQVR